MHVIDARNVSEAYVMGMRHLSTFGVREQSRAGEVLVAPTPVTTVYHRPTERVLLDARRDANPFFHLMESVWMLAGMRDARWLDLYVQDFSRRFAEDDGDAHGAYGYRWRRHFRRSLYDGDPVSSPVDQLLEAAQILRDSPGSRQAVIAMWDPAVDLGAVKRDIPCNDLIMLRGRPDRMDNEWELDMTVSCRSNDAVWGAYGANAVHFSVMQEVLAGLCGMRVGRYYQVSNNFHVYLDVMGKVWPPSIMEPMDMYTLGHIQAQPIIGKSTRDGRVGTATSVLEDCEEFMGRSRDEWFDRSTQFKSAWFKDVIRPMHNVHLRWREKNLDKAMAETAEIGATDWQFAARSWLARRIARRTGVPATRSM